LTNLQSELTSPDAGSLSPSGGGLVQFGGRGARRGRNRLRAFPRFFRTLTMFMPSKEVLAEAFTTPRHNVVSTAQGRNQDCRARLHAITQPGVDWTSLKKPCANVYSFIISPNCLIGSIGRALNHVLKKRSIRWFQSKCQVD
jgi:hypothetical protein